MLPQQLCRTTQTVVYSIASAYGFQLFNLDPDGKEWVTATAGLAADQLLVLLRDAAARHMPAQGGNLQDCFLHWKQAVQDVHSQYFKEYDSWQTNLQLPHPASRKRDRQLQGPGQVTGENAVLVQLMELSLQFCIYTEGANLRHTPHLLCLVYYIMRSSTAFQEAFIKLTRMPSQPGQQQQQQRTLPCTHWLYWLWVPAEDFPAAAAVWIPQKSNSNGGLDDSIQVACQDVSSASTSSSSSPRAGEGAAQPPASVVAGACDITTLRRSLLQQLFAAAPTAFDGPAASAVARPAPDLQKQLSSTYSGLQPSGSQLLPTTTSVGRDALRQSLDAAQATILGRVPPQHVPFVNNLLVEMRETSWLQTQQRFLMLVVQPLFFFLAEQIDLAGQQMEEDPALRIAYDDVNEHCCSPESVGRLLEVLERQYLPSDNQPDQKPADDLWSALHRSLNSYISRQKEHDQRKGKAQKIQKQPGSGRKADLDPVVQATSRYPRDFRREDVLRRLAEVLKRQRDADKAAADGEVASAEVSARAATNARIVFEPADPITLESRPLNEVYEFAKHGADWWAVNMFRHKTFVEARSVASPFVAFWRVYNFHAALLTVMGALGYIWETGGDKWPARRIIAAFLLTTVTDALMRAARAGAYMMLAVYTLWRVRRKVRLCVQVDHSSAGRRSWFLSRSSSRPRASTTAFSNAGQDLEIRDVIVDLNPFPPGSFKQLCLRTLQLLFWLSWAGFLGIFLAMQVTERGNEGFIDLLEGQASSNTARYKFALFVKTFWMLPAVVHIVVVWGLSVLRQRNGYVARNVWQSLKAAPFYLHSFCFRKPPHAAHRVAHSSTSVDKIDALFYPSSNLRIDAKRAWVNFCLWVVVVAIKVAFELLVVIIPLVRLMRELLTLSGDVMLQKALNVHQSSQPGASTASNVLILTALAFPVVLMSFSDTGMFFSVVGALVSAARGFKRGVGSIKNWSEMVQGFEVLQQQYMKHCMSLSALQLHVEDKRDPHAVQQASMCAIAAGWNALVLDLRQRDLLSTKELAIVMFEQLQLTHSQKQHLLNEDHLKALKLTTVLPARCFLAGAVGELASGAVGNTHHLWVAQVVWGWLLWVLWQTGLLNTYGGKHPQDSADAVEASAREQATHHLRSLTKLRLLYPAKLESQPARWSRMLSEAVRLLGLLSKGRTPSNLSVAAAELLRSQGEGAADAGVQGTGLLHGLPLKQRDLREAVRDLAYAMNNLIDLVTEELEAVCASPKLMKRLNLSERDLSNVHHTLIQLKARWGDSAQRAAKEEEQARIRQNTLASLVSADGLLPQKDNMEEAAERIAQVGRASDGPAQVVQYLSNVLTMYEGDTQPVDDEAVRFIVSFACSLRDPDLGTAPSLQECPSVCTLVPHYNEDVLYALSEDDALADLKVADPAKLDAKSKAEMLYLLSPDGSSTPTLSYLRSVYNTSGEAQTQWSNFEERIRALAVARGISKAAISSTVYESHFLPGGPLHPLKQELLLWASWRGQLLARTVRGLMSYRTAMQAIARHENPHFLHLGLEQHQHQQQQPPQPTPPTRSQQQQQKPLAQPTQPQRRGLFTFRFGQQQQPQQQQQSSANTPAAEQPAEQRQPLQVELDLLLDKQRLLRNKQRQLTAQRNHADTQLKSEQELQKELEQHLQQLQQQQQQDQEELDPLVRRQVRQLRRQLDHLKHLVDSRTGRLSGFDTALAETQAELKQAEAKLVPLQEQQRYWEAFRDVVLDDLVDSKYHLVVSSQNFGVFASKEESSKNIKSAWLAHSVGVLRQLHPTFKVAYIDRQLLVTVSRPGQKVELFRHASVLLTSHQQHQLAAAAGLPSTQQAYRVLLPINFESARGVVIGEGKPENQNHAVVFCPGEALQTIDCNQDNIVAEGLKLRNLLAELRPQKHAELSTQKQVALVGFRENIFSEDSGVLAEFAAATERSFGTTVQRLMYNPGAVRFHYGHPDVWSRVFVSTCGGVSKANKGLHVSEDVFGGYNVILRGREIKYVDYISVGKGRDMGFETINTFEAKIAAGNGEQVLSRDVRRLGHNMSFFRLLTWYHTGNGFFINTALNMASVHASLWAYLLLALGKYSNQEVQASLSGVQLLQLGTMSTLVYLFTLGLEIGLFRSVWTICRQALQGSLMFYIFRAQTTAYSFTYDLLFGGAKYLPTGRGYKLAPTSFKDLYRRFGRSHFYFGAMLLQYAVACVAAGHEQGLKLLVLWGPLLVVLSLLFGPFWFTPFAFRTGTVRADWQQMQAWFSSPSTDSAISWSAWNADAWRAASNADGKQLGRFGAGLRAVLLKLPTFLMMLAAASRMKRHPGLMPDGFPNYAIAAIIAVAALIAVWIVVRIKRHQAMTGLRHHSMRVAGMAITLFVFVGVIIVGFSSSGSSNFFELRNSSNTALIAFATILLLRLLPLTFYIAPFLSPLCSAIYYVADVVLTSCLNGLRFVLSLFDILTGLQAQLLFNTAYARQVMADTSLQHSVLPKLVKQALQQQKVVRMRQAAVQQAQL